MNVDVRNEDDEGSAARDLVNCEVIAVFTSVENVE